MRFLTRDCILRSQNSHEQLYLTQGLPCEFLCSGTMLIDEQKQEIKYLTKSH